MRTPTRSTARTAVVASLIGAATFAGGSAVAGNFTEPSAQDNPLVQRGCVIRFDTSGPDGKTQPRIHANSKHYCVGVTSEPTVDDRGRLVVRTDGSDQAIVTIAVNPDETLTEKGISCGGSGGSGVTRITCTDREGKVVPADSPQMHDKYANLWLGWTTWQK
ncbi:hypothetical protein [Demetria terragena]|uniref:hypothetical protein n=1 Tax=Demetria terragena TaxID=63959 RepID=UPI00036B4263|nr:hypothetical protein [Demetria terragena]